MKKRVTAILMCLTMLAVMCVATASTAGAYSPTGAIAGNGTNGIYIDITSYPYTNYQNKNYGGAAYGPQGCAWFAAARYSELTGYSGAIWSGTSWYNGQYANYGLSRGSTVKAKAFACYDNHIAVVERVDGNIVTVSEGGATGYPSNSYCSITTKTVAQLQQYDSLRGNFLGYVYLGVSAANEPLTTPDITLDKESYTVSDTVNVSWVASSPNSIISHYWIHIVAPSGAILVSERINNSTQYSFTAAEEGQYYIGVSATPVGSQAGEGSLTAEKYVSVAPAAGKPVITAVAGNSANETKFFWNKTDNTAKYSLNIKKSDGSFEKNYDIAVEKTSFSTVLSAGSYTAALTAYSSNGAATASDAVSFNVSATTDNDGWIYSDTLPTGGSYEIQYKYTYEKKSSTDLSDGWTKSSTCEKVYENSGEPYWSAIELATSDTRELLSYYYYHYCGGSNGNNANFTATSAYPHYDWISKDNVYEYSVGTDYDDARYKFYHLKWSDGSDAYCSSGVTCDGSHGAHGNRTCYWYKNYQYQDKIAVDYYTYTNEGQWTTAVESGYFKVTYRYRLKGEGLLGDVNGDGKITVVDATMIQKHCASLITLDADALVRADVNRKGGVNVQDATAIQKYVADLIQKFG